MGRISRLLLIAAIVVASIGFDQITKLIATLLLRDVPGGYSYVGDTIRLVYSENPGSFLGLGGDLPAGARFAVFIVGVGLLLFALFIYIARTDRPPPAIVTGVGLILGGGLSNWGDRIVNGNVVVDFMNVGLGSLRTGIFNVADLLIEAGMIVLIVSTWRASPTPATQPEMEPAER
ncbi:MAG: signal peptidase II [Chloroflexota bacterium]|nr:MAG: signal peptidase II [Chloroflexota bacterium]